MYFKINNGCCKKIILILSLFLSTHVFAAGKIFYKRGNLTINKKAGAKNTPVKAGDIIITGKKSLAIIILNNGSKIKLSENTKLKLGKVDDKKTGTSVALLKGNAFFNVIKERLRGKKKFNVKTRSVSMGVRGTEFFASYGKGKSKDIWMCVNRGKVLIKAKNEKKARLVNAGEGVRVKDGKKTSKPRPLAWTKKLNWEMDPTKGDVKNEINIEAAYTDILDEDYD